MRIQQVQKLFKAYPETLSPHTGHNSSRPSFVSGASCVENSSPWPPFECMVEGVDGPMDATVEHAMDRVKADEWLLVDDVGGPVPDVEPATVGTKNPEGSK